MNILVISPTYYISCLLDEHFGHQTLKFCLKNFGSQKELIWLLFLNSWFTISGNEANIVFNFILHIMFYDYLTLWFFPCLELWFTILTLIIDVFTILTLIIDVNYWIFEYIFLTASLIWNIFLYLLKITVWNEYWRVIVHCYVFLTKCLTWCKPLGEQRFFEWVYLIKWKIKICGLDLWEIIHHVE
jgi:hypothetical protein